MDASNTTPGTRLVAAEPLADPARDALRRPWENRPIASDSFGYDQEDVDRLAGADPDVFNEFMDALTYEEAHHVLDRLADTAEEHRRRAAAADTVAATIRERFTELAHHSLPAGDGAPNPSVQAAMNLRHADRAAR